MNVYLLADHLLQYALNGLIAFLLFSFMTEGVIRLFKIRSGRLCALFRLIPPARLVIEPLLLLVPSVPLLLNASLFSCSHPLQYYLYGLLSAETISGMNPYDLKTVSGSLLLKVPQYLLLAMVVIIAAKSLFQVVSALVHYIATIKRIRKMQKGGTAFDGSIGNAKLRERLIKNRTKIMFSDEVTIPFAGWGNVIIMPESMAKVMTQEEFETVIAHELEHLCWHDNLVRLVYHLIAAIHWWVPMSNWYGRVEHDQEIACDSSIFRYEFNEISLATALQKSLEQQHRCELRCAAFAVSNQSKKGILERIHSVLNSSASSKQNRACAFAGCLALLALILTLGFTIC